MNFAGLAAHPSEDGLILDLFHTLVQIARSARSQVHSGLFEGLEDASSTAPKGEEEDETPQVAYVQGREGRQQSDADRTHDNPAEETPAPLRWPNIRNAEIHQAGFVSRLLSTRTSGQEASGIVRGLIAHSFRAYHFGILRDRNRVDPAEGGSLGRQE